MVEQQGYKLTVKYNGQDIGIDNYTFDSFVINESLNYNTYFGELRLKQNIYWESMLITGEELTISVDIETINDNTETILTNYSYDFIIFDYKLYQTSIVITMVPKFFHKLYLEEVTKGYNDKIEIIVETVCNDIGITDVELERSSTQKRLMLQLNQTNLNFLKNIYEYIDSYLFFINKENKAIIRSFTSLMNKQTKYTINQVNMVNLKMENDVYALQMMGGFGATGYYFDWDSASMKDYKYNQETFGVYNKDMNPLNKQNNIKLMVAPVSSQKEFYPSENYNFNKVKNRINNKNLFKIFIQFDVYHAFDLNVGDKVHLFIKNKMDNENNEKLTGDYLAYAVINTFSYKISTHVICSTPFIMTEVDNFKGKAQVSASIRR